MASGKNKFPPSKGELYFRLAFSVAGMCLLAGAILYRGWPQGIAGVETIGIATAFFGGTLLWTINKLIRKEYS